jgi:thymidylate kinase
VQFGNEVEERFGEDKRKFWSIIKSMRGKYGKRVRSVKNQENKMETEATKVLEVWRLHYEEKFRLEKGEARVLEAESPEILGDINEKEIKEALKKMGKQQAGMRQL